MHLAFSTMHRTLHSASLSSLLPLISAISVSSIFATALGSKSANTSLYMSLLLSISVQLWSMSIPDSASSSKRRLSLYTGTAQHSSWN
uniref:Csu92a n=1 Tax=Arundo donax TaxID=35708 RepID=A0A0A9D3U5_ARUDO